MIADKPDRIGQWPLTKELFAEIFCEPGSTITHHDAFELHARQSLIDDRNFMGLFALDTLLSNRLGEYRRDDITPKSNHPLLVFFQVQNFIESDRSKETNYLPDRPDLDLVAALLHDEGEDIKGYTKEHLMKQMHLFVDNIHEYVTQHNIDYPTMILDHPTEAEIAQMRSDIQGIADTFDILTKGYKGQEEKDYIQYHRDVLKDERAMRIKLIDKACNGATFVYRSREMLEGVLQSFPKYREWVFDQIARMKDIYLNQNFLGETPKGVFNSETDFQNRGFIRAAMQLHPQSADMVKVMGDVIKSQVILYDHNIANERQAYVSSEPPISARPYQNIALAPSIDLINILQNRFEEVQRMDTEPEPPPITAGMFGVQFTEKRTLHIPHIPIPLINASMRRVEPT